MSDTPSKDALQDRLTAAERTVTVLKRQVRRLYDQGAQTAIHRQIESARRRDEKARRRREVMQARADELERHSARLEKEVEERTRDIRIILDNVTFGFVLVDRDLAIREGFTRSCATLFAREVRAGDSLGELLRVHGTSREFELQLGVDQVFDDLMPEEVSLDQLPSRFVVDARTLRIEGSTVRVHGEVDALLLTVSDITDLEAAQAESRRNAVLLNLLRQRGAFEEFLDDTRQLLHVARKSTADVLLVRRIVHTIKGNAGSYGLHSVAQVAHGIEERPVIDRQALDELEGSLRAFLLDNYNTLEMDYDGHEHPPLTLDVEALSELVHLDAGSRVEAPVRGWVESVSLAPAADFLGPLSGLVERLSQRMGKQVRLEIEGSEVPIDRDALRPVFRTLPHLLRNALDHGLEEPEERGSKGIVGTLAVRVRDAGPSWVVEVEDDGRGIDAQALRIKAEEMGVFTAAELDRIPRERLLELIFEDGLSTAATVSDISGRGVGMAAVRSAVAEVSGTLDVSTERGRGTRIHIEVPKFVAIAEMAV